MYGKLTYTWVIFYGKCWYIFHGAWDTEGHGITSLVRQGELGILGILLENWNANGLQNGSGTGAILVKLGPKWPKAFCVHL